MATKYKLLPTVQPTAGTVRVGLVIGRQVNVAWIDLSPDEAFDLALELLKAERRAT